MLSGVPQSRHFVSLLIDGLKDQKQFSTAGMNWKSIVDDFRSLKGWNWSIFYPCNEKLRFPTIPPRSRSKYRFCSQFLIRNDSTTKALLGLSRTLLKDIFCFIYTHNFIFPLIIQIQLHPKQCDMSPFLVTYLVKESISTKLGEFSHLISCETA